MPDKQRVSYEAQLSSAQAVDPAAKLAQIVVDEDPAHSTAFFFTATNGLSHPRFVDPYSGRVLGEV
jgi:uncharacterized iron-regulated membrane protein